jgi:hypothetical protein
MSLSFSVFGDSMSINQNSKYFAGIRRAYTVRSSQERYRRANWRKGNRTFRVRLTLDTSQHTTHSTQHTAHNTQHTNNTHSTQHITQHISHITQHTTHNTQHTTHNTQHTSHSTHHTSHSTSHSTQHTAQHTAQHTSHITQHTTILSCPSFTVLSFKTMHHFRWHLAYLLVLTPPDQQTFDINT